jgi:hypothetical protein
VTSAGGTEDQAVRKLKNPFEDRAVRADYYQLIRKWKVELHRYGIRLTYDLTLPEPGGEVLSKIREAQEIRAALSQPFGDPQATLPWARFDLTPNQLNRLSYHIQAARFGAVVDDPPLDFPPRITAHFDREWESFEESGDGWTATLEFDVDADYAIDQAIVNGSTRGFQGHDNDGFVIGFHQNLDRFVLRGSDIINNHPVASLEGKSGRLAILLQGQQLSAASISVELSLRLRPEPLRAWQLRAWKTIYDAALARYDENRLRLTNRLSELTDELGGQDALSLRKLEREEVMKGVLRWIFGPTFRFVPEDLPSELYDDETRSLEAGVWSRVSAQGEVIRFLHQAVEWENMLFFLYPYFWSHQSRWEFKKYLDHPDPLHKAFLKAGAARVVLTIRPGFEKAFFAFVENLTFDFDALPETPYVTIVEEMEAFAKTNYPGIAPANAPVDVRPLLYPSQRRAWEAMQSIMRALEQFLARRGRYPTTAEGLAALGPAGRVKDPWDNDFMYTSPGRYGPYELLSLGADGQPGGEEEAADIPSWAEASLVGTWYEYTPTSALDIAWDEILPTA